MIGLYMILSTILFMLLAFAAPTKTAMEIRGKIFFTIFAMFALGTSLMYFFQ